MSQRDGEGEVARFERSVRKGRGAFGLILGALTLGVLGLCAWLALHARTPRTAGLGSAGSRLARWSVEEETPEWLDEGAMGSRSTRSRFGIEGPQHHRDPAMAREQAKEQAANASIVGILKATSAPWQSAHAEDRVADDDSDDWLPREQAERARLRESADPMSGLGALMGDEVGANFGTIGTIGHGSDGTGRGGGGSLFRGRSARLRPAAMRAAPAARKPSPAPLARSPSAAPTSPVPVPAPTAVPRSTFRARSNRPALLSTLVTDATLATDTPSLPAPATPAAALLARYATLRGVTPIDAHGYFANTYVPGDPELRALQARLSGYDRRALLPAELFDARLDTGAQRNAQPFDAPEQAALALFVAGSERGLTGPRRMLVQVGLRATERRGGPRPAMKLALVVDLRQALDAARASLLLELLSSFARARQPGDELSLYAAGPGGGLVVGPETFRLGPLTVALQTRLGSRGGAQFDLAQALRTASARVRSDDADHSLLGSSAVVFVTGHALGAARMEVEQLVRASALDGVPVSALGLGASADTDELSALALAGQGSRRLLRVPEDAAPAVQAELEAVARVVARAVRLRIRLAPGVQLLSVLGSHPLDAPQADDVRKAENAVDQRVARSLGIERDRGQDEEGVQIVIPAFHAGDAHVVLLDVVASGPGPIAEATVRFKDLVQLGNGVARASLALPNAALARGPLERNVITNLFAYEVATQLDAAGDAVADGSTAHARDLLRDALAVLQSVGDVVPELGGDRALAADRALLAEYEAVLASVLSAPQRAFAADSLHFASLVKLGPRPEGDLRAQL